MNLMRLMGAQITAAGTAIGPATPPLPPWPTPVPPGPIEAAVTYPDGVPEAPSATYLIPTIDSTTTDELPYPPSYPLELVLTFPKERVFESTLGYESIQTAAAQGRRGYQLPWFALSVSEKNTLLDFFKSHRRSSFVWTAPGDSERNWKLISAAVIVQEVSPGCWNVQATIAEVLG